VRALKQMIDHPLIFRDSIRELDKPQNAYKSIFKVNNNNLNLMVSLFEMKFHIFLKERAKQKSSKVQPKLTQVNEILDTLRERKIIKETNLKDALSKTDDKLDVEKSKRLLEKTQKKYEEIKRESLKLVNAPRKPREKIKKDLEILISESISRTQS
jgi:hypothetical protein